MPVYEYLCEKCGKAFEEVLPVARCREPVFCPDCGAEGKKQVSQCNFNLSGDGWPSKHERVKKQMAAKNRRLDAKAKDLPKVSLVPNVDGEQTDTWVEAKKLAKSKGKIAETYTPQVEKEKAKA